MACTCTTLPVSRNRVRVRAHPRRIAGGTTAVGAHARNRVIFLGSRETKTQEAREIRQGMARAAFVDMWARKQEENGRSFSGQNIMDVAPKRTSPAANRWAKEVAQAISSANQDRGLHFIYRKAVGEYGYTGDARTFGHYLGMQAMGHGVAWDDDLSGVPRDAIKVPHREFYD